MGAVPIGAAKEQIMENEPASPERIAVARLSLYYLQGVSLSSASLSYSSMLSLLPISALPSSMPFPSSIHPLYVFPNKSSHLFPYTHPICTFTPPFP